jgi:hypothetical protein
MVTSIKTRLVALINQPINDLRRLTIRNILCNLTQFSTFLHENNIELEIINYFCEVRKS